MAALLPDSVAVEERLGDADVGSLLPQEEAQLGAVAPKRRREFARGRACARAALGRLGYRAEPLLAGSRREPLWPPGVVGSITHTEGYCAAAVAQRCDLAAVGIDVEIDEPLPSELLSLVCVDEERVWLNAEPRETFWARVLFSAKESVYKTWYPLTRRWLGFQDVAITIAGADSFVAELRVPGAVIGGRRVASFLGRYAVRGGLVLTAVFVPALTSPREP